MKKIKFFNDYIKEYCTDSISNRASELLDKMINMFVKTFQGENEIFGNNELEYLNFIDIEKSNYNDAFEKNILMNFEDGINRYQIFFIIKLNDIKGVEPIEDAYMIIKIYDNNTINTTPDQYKYNLKIKIPNEDEILNEGRFHIKVKEIDEKDIENKKSNDNDSGYQFIEEFIIEKIGKLSELKNK